MLIFLRSKILTTAALIFLAILGFAENNHGFQASDLVQLKRDFIAEFSKDFQFVKAELKNHSLDAEKNQYWMAHVQPKNTGFFTIKYEYLYADKFYAEGETEMKIAVGGKNCSRYPQTVREISYFCLGDTIIVPLRLSKSSKYSFSLQSKYADSKDIAESRKTYNSYPNLLENEKIVNPLESNIKYLGKYRVDNLYRSGGGTFTHFAIFEAKSKGRFNIALSDEDKKANDSTIRITPVIIVNPGTPLTLLVPQEKATYYIKGRTYSTDYTNSFESNLIILQPGEVFAIPFLFASEDPWWKDKDKLTKVTARNPNPIPFIFKQPFYIKTDEGFNDWINNDLP